LQLTKMYGCVVIAIGLTALLAGPAWSQDADVDTAKALLTRGIEQFDAMRFDEAKQTLLKIKPADLPTNADRDQFAAYMDKINLAMIAQSKGREQFRQGQALLTEGKFAEAEAMFQQVLANDFVPEPMKTDAKALAATAKAKQARRIAQQQAVEAEPAAPAPEPAKTEPAKTEPAKTEPAEPADTAVEAPKPVNDQKELESAAAEQQAAKPEAKPTETWVAPEKGEAAPAPATGDEPVLDEQARRRLAARAAEIRAEADARKLVEQGTMALEVGNATKAAEAFRKALELVGGMPEAQAGLDKAAELLPRTPSGSMEILLQREKIALEKAQANFDKAIADARDMLATAETEREFRTAAERARYAASILEGNKRLFAADDYNNRREVADGLLETILQQQDRWNREQVRIKRKEAIELAAKYEKEQLSQRAARIETLRDRARQLEQEQRYNQAIELVEEILRLDPIDAWAGAKVESLKQFALREHQAAGFKGRMGEEARHIAEIESDMTPWYDILRYPRTPPKDWAEITRRRKGLGDEYDTPANRETAAKLDVVRSLFQFDETEFQEVVVFLRQVTEANIVVDWPQIEAAGLGRDTPVTLMLTNVSARLALDEILASVAGAVELGYMIKDGVVRISTRQDLATTMETHVYEINDLLIQVPDFAGPVVSISRNQASTGGGGGSSGGIGGGGGGGTFGGGGGGTFGGGGGGGGFGAGSAYGGGQGGAQGGAAASRQQLVADILDAVRTIDPTSWIANGGADASIRELNGSAIVTQTPENHKKVQDLFAQLRESQAVAVNVEFRSITVQTGFLNDVGMNFNFFLNIGSTLTQSAAASDPAAFDPITGARLLSSGSTALPQWSAGRSWSNRMTPLGITQRSSSFSAFPDTAVAGGIAMDALSSTGGFGAMSFGGSFLDDIQVDFLVRATQADQRKTEFIAPQVTLMSGQRGFVMNGTEQAYVSDLEAVTNENVATFDTEVSTVFTGQTFDVQATVSHDRRYVTMTVRPTTSRVLNFFDYAVDTASTDASTVQSGVINLPEIALNTLGTTVVVPDGGTILIGGQRIAGEVSKEMGVPILNKIPIINRFFSNRGSSRDEVIQLFLIKPTILIRKEYEEDYFAN